MKFVSDNQQVFAHSTVDRKPDSKPFECHDNALDSTGRKSGNSIVREYENGVLCSSKANEGGAEKLPYMTNDGDGWNVKKLDVSKNLNDKTNDDKKDVRDLAAQHFHSHRETESFEDSVFYMDKSVMECELPELIVCYKESTYHVKDICIDEGVPSQERVLFESDVNEKGVCSFLSPEKDKSDELMEGKINTSFLPPEKDKSDELMEGKINTVMPLPNVLKSSAENNSNMDMVNQYGSSPEIDSDKDTVDLCDSKDLMLMEEVKDNETDKIANDISKKFSLGDLLSMQHLGTENLHSKLSDNNDTEAEKEQGSDGKAVLASAALDSPAEESNGGNEEGTLVSCGLVSAAEESNNGSEEGILASPALVSTIEEIHNYSKEATLASPNLVSREVVLASTGLVSSTKESNCGTEKGILVSSDLVSTAEEKHNECKETTLTSPDLVSKSEESTKRSSDDKLLHDSKVETGSITFDFDPSAPTARVKEECPQNGGSKQIEVPDTSRLEDAPRQSVSSQVHSGIGESSFSATGPLSGLISYSGPIAYSGSLSLRSDSSTTSTRSFAFPILQSEWNSSPVRMAKADRRHFRKQKCWRQGLLCCRF